MNLICKTRAAVAIGVFSLGLLAQDTASPSASSSAKGMLKPGEVQNLLKSAKTAADRQLLARHFTATAEWLENQAKEYETLPGNAAGAAPPSSAAYPGQLEKPVQSGQYTDSTQVGRPVVPATAQPNAAAQTSQSGQPSPSASSGAMIGHGLSGHTGNSFQLFAKHCREAAAEMRKLAAVHARP